MTIKSTLETKDSADDEQLTLVIDGGELKTMNEIMQKWKFKDYQSMIQFAISILVLNEDMFISLKRDGVLQNVVPTADLLKIDAKIESNG